MSTEGVKGLKSKFCLLPACYWRIPSTWRWWLEGSAAGVYCTLLSM